MLFKAVCLARWRAIAASEPSNAEMRRTELQGRLARVPNTSDQSVDSKLRPRLDLLSIRMAKANLHRMSLAEIEQAVDKLSRDELAKLAAYIPRQDKLGWDEQIEEDFAPGGKHAPALERIDAEIDGVRVQ